MPPAADAADQFNPNRKRKPTLQQELARLRSRGEGDISSVNLARSRELVDEAIDRKTGSNLGLVKVSDGLKRELNDLSGATRLGVAAEADERVAVTKIDAGPDSSSSSSSSSSSPATLPALEGSVPRPTTAPVVSTDSVTTREAGKEAEAARDEARAARDRALARRKGSAAQEELSAARTGEERERLEAGRARAARVREDAAARALRGSRGRLASLDKDQNSQRILLSEDERSMQQVEGRLRAAEQAKAAGEAGAQAAEAEAEAARRKRLEAETQARVARDARDTAKGDAQDTAGRLEQVREDETREKAKAREREGRAEALAGEAKVYAHRAKAEGRVVEEDRERVKREEQAVAQLRADEAKAEMAALRDSNAAALDASDAKRARSSEERNQRRVESTSAELSSEDQARRLTDKASTQAQQRAAGVEGLASSMGQETRTVEGVETSPREPAGKAVDADAARTELDMSAQAAGLLAKQATRNAGDLAGRKQMLDMRVSQEKERVKREEQQRDEARREYQKANSARGSAETDAELAKGRAAADEAQMRRARLKLRDAAAAEHEAKELDRKYASEAAGDSERAQAEARRAASAKAQALQLQVKDDKLTGQESREEGRERLEQAKVDEALRAEAAARREKAKAEAAEADDRSRARAARADVERLTKNDDRLKSDAARRKAKLEADGALAEAAQRREAEETERLARAKRLEGALRSERAADEANVARDRTEAAGAESQAVTLNSKAASADRAAELADREARDARDAELRLRAANREAEWKTRLHNRKATLAQRDQVKDQARYEESLIKAQARGDRVKELLYRSNEEELKAAQKAARVQDDRAQVNREARDSDQKFDRYSDKVKQAMNYLGEAHRREVNARAIQATADVANQ